MSNRHRSDHSSFLAAIRLLVFAAILLSVPAAFGQRYHFILRNGDRLTGEVVAEDKVSVIITNALIGRVLIPAAQLERREAVTATPAPAPGAPGSPAIAGAPAATDTNTPPAVLPPLTPQQKSRLNDVVRLYMSDQITPSEFQRRRASILTPPPPLAPAPKRWSGELQAGIDAGVGTKDRQYFTGRTKLNYAGKYLRNAFDYLFTYGHAEGQLSADRMDATDKLDFDLNPQYYVYSLAGGGRDAIRQIDYYWQAGPGLGQHIIKRTNFVLNAEAGANYQFQNFTTANDTYLFYYRLAQDLRWVLSSRLSLEQKLEYTPQWNDFSQYKIRGEANLKFLLWNNLSLNLTVIDQYDTRVPEGISPNDLQVRSTIGIRF